jgi:hypothetical protein
VFGPRGAGAAVGEQLHLRRQGSAYSNFALTVRKNIRGAIG